MSNRILSFDEIFVFHFRPHGFLEKAPRIFNGKKKSTVRRVYNNQKWRHWKKKIDCTKLFEKQFIVLIIENF